MGFPFKRKQIKRKICGKELIDRDVEFNWDKVESKGLGALADNETISLHSSYFFFFQLENGINHDCKL